MEFIALENERWVWAKTFNGDYSHYLVSDMGRCWNCKTKQFVGHWLNGYWTVCLSKSRKETECLMVGRLMLISFGIPIPEHLKDLPTNKVHCMHLDGDSTNNNLSNFAWGDSNENANEENAIRRKSEAHKGKFGKEHQKSKQIIQYTKYGEFIKEWDCMTDVERELGINHSSISACARGKRPTAGGYIWKYKEVA